MYLPFTVHWFTNLNILQLQEEPNMCMYKRTGKVCLVSDMLRVRFSFPFFPVGVALSVREQLQLFGENNYTNLFIRMLSKAFVRTQQLYAFYLEKIALST